VVAIWSDEYVIRSWKLFEGSANPGGLPGLFVLKTFIPFFVLLVGLQGLSMLARSLLVLAGRESLLPERFRYPAEQK
jgi:TRAP-type mannitol/chloroaromatic compound transport system permease small subunit